MSPEARLIASAILRGGGFLTPKDVAAEITALEAALPPAEPPKGLIPVGYLRDCLEAAIYRFEHPTGEARDEPVAYLKRRLADVETL